MSVTESIAQAIATEREACMEACIRSVERIRDAKAPITVRGKVRYRDLTILERQLLNDAIADIRREWHLRGDGNSQGRAS